MNNKNKKMVPQTTIIEPIVFGYMFCLFATFPLQEQLIYRKVCHHNFNSTYCEILYKSKNTTFKAHQNILQEETSNWQIYFSIARSLPAIAATLVFGIWSDRIGRKTFIILPIIGNSLEILCLILSSYYFDSSISYIFIGTFTASIFGSYAMLLSALYSYVADITSPSFRTSRTMILESMTPLGSILCNLGAGFMLQYYGFIAVFVAILCLYVLVMIYWVFIKETRRNTFGDNNTERISCSSKSLYRIIRVFTMKRPNKFRMTILLLVGCFFCISCFFIGLNQFIVLYVLHQPLNFSPSMIGYFLAEINAIKFVGSCLLNYILLYRLKWHDNQMIVICALSYAGFSLCVGFSNVSVSVFISCIWAAGFGVGSGAVRGRLSKLVSPKEQGKMFASLACFEVIIQLFSGVMFNSIYKATVRISPSISFYLLAALCVIPMALAFMLIFFGEKGEYVNLKNITDEEED